MSKVTEHGRQATTPEEREVGSVPYKERGMTRKARREYMREIRAGVPHEKTYQGQRERLANYYANRRLQYGRSREGGGHV